MDLTVFNMRHGLNFPSVKKFSNQFDLYFHCLQFIIDHNLKQRA